MDPTQVVVGKGRRLTLPRAALAEANIAEGQALRVECTAEGLLLRPVEERDPDQWWFWTEKWQQMEREADEDIAAGRGIIFLDDEAFIQSLEDLHESLGGDEGIDGADA